MSTLPIPADNDLVTLALRQRHAGLSRTICVMNAPWPTRSVESRPVSADTLQRYFDVTSCGADPRSSLHDLLVATLPRDGRWYRRSMATLLMRCSDELRDTAVEALVMTAGLLPDSAADSRHGVLDRWRTVVTPAHRAPLTLQTAIDITRAAFGDPWYYNADQWRTNDGTPPAGRVLVDALAVLASLSNTTAASPTPAPVPRPSVLVPARSQTRLLN
ncbi:MAG: hypothetical protein ABMA00_21005 [Gemmatimonas sp.]